MPREILSTCQPVNLSTRTENGRQFDKNSLGGVNLLQSSGLKVDRLTLRFFASYVFRINSLSVNLAKVDRLTVLRETIFRNLTRARKTWNREHCDSA